MIECRDPSYDAFEFGVGLVGDRDALRFERGQPAQQKQLVAEALLVQQANMLASE